MLRRPTQTPPRSILVVETETLRRHNIPAILLDLGHHLAAAPSAEAALASVETVRPDLVLLDTLLEQPHDGIEFAIELRQRFDLPVLYVTAHTDRGTLERAKAADPAGYLSVPCAAAQLCIAVEVGLHTASRERQLKDEARAEGRRADDLATHAAMLRRRLEQIAEVLADGGSLAAAVPPPPPSPELQERLDSMTRRERDVIRRLLAGRRVSGISREMKLSVYTVRNHLRSAFRKLRVHSQEELLEVLRDHPRL